MTTLTASLPIDWSNFNSSLVIEVTRPTGVSTYTGVAINPETVLTAAHCLDGDVLKVRVSIDSAYSKKSKFLPVEEFELHPQHMKHGSDLAKIKLKTKLPNNICYFPIIKHGSPLNGQILRLGFGERSNKNVRTLVTPYIKHLRHFENMLELNDTYSYSGDTGGPVFMQKNGQMYLVAIHSRQSSGPEGKYSFNPLVSSHRSWIEN
jgi:V8-like Glu-specific endopeptidase